MNGLTQIGGDGFSITDPAFQQCPFPYYDAMLAERPIWRDPVTQFWVVTRYEDVRGVLASPQVWSSRADQIFNRTSTVADQVRAIYEAEGYLCACQVHAHVIHQSLDAPQPLHVARGVIAAIAPGAGRFDEAGALIIA